MKRRFKTKHKRQRNALKKVYRQKKREDREIGIRLSLYLKEFYSETSLLCKNESVPEDKKIRIENLAKEISNIRKVKRFREEFPSFAAFKKNLKKEELGVEDLIGL